MLTTIVFCSFILLVPLGGIFWLYALTCSWPENNGNFVLRALVVSDVHLLGDRKRSSLDRYWTDWSLQMSFTVARMKFQPDIVLNIGDVLDEGKRSNDDQYRSYMERAQQIFLRGQANKLSKSSSTSATLGTSFSTILSSKALPHYTTVGNHDVGWRFLNDWRLFTFERDHHHSSNHFFQVHNLTFARINSMALHPDAIKTSGGKKHGLEIENMLKSNRHVDVLLTHMPLYRHNDLQCGQERKRDPEDGGVTFYPASKTLIPNDDVVDEKFTSRILTKWTPTTILSGHLHSVCRFKHLSGSQELTIPTFSWRMRPDPKYFLISFDKIGNIHAKQCNLPHEHVYMFVVTFGIGLVVVLTGWEVYTRMKRRSRLNSKEL